MTQRIPPKSTSMTTEEVAAAARRAQLRAQANNGSKEASVALRNELKASTEAMTKGAGQLIKDGHLKVDSFDWMGQGNYARNVTVTNSSGEVVGKVTMDLEGRMAAPSAAEAAATVLARSEGVAEGATILARLARSLSNVSKGMKALGVAPMILSAVLDAKDTLDPKKVDAAAQLLLHDDAKGTNAAMMMMQNPAMYLKASARARELYKQSLMA